MPAPFYPDPNVVTFRGNARKAIVDTTNTAPIVIKVTAHGAATGDVMQIENADDPNAIGYWNITRIDADHFSLDGSTGTLVGGAAGIAENWTMLPIVQLPSDGDDVDGANANPPTERALDIGAWPGSFGRWRLLDAYYNSLNDGRLANTTWSTNTTGGTAAYLFAQNTPLLGFSGGSDPVQIGTDLIVVQISTTYQQTGGAAIMELAIGCTAHPVGNNKVPGSGLRLPNNYNGPLTLTGYWRPQSSSTGYFDYGILYADDNAGETFVLKSDWTIFVHHYRLQP